MVLPLVALVRFEQLRPAGVHGPKITSRRIDGPEIITTRIDGFQSISTTIIDGPDRPDHLHDNRWTRPRGFRI